MSDQWKPPLKEKYRKLRSSASRASAKASCPPTDSQTASAHYYDLIQERRRLIQGAGISPIKRSKNPLELNSSFINPQGDTTNIKKENVIQTTSALRMRIMDYIAKKESEDLTQNNEVKDELSKKSAYGALERLRKQIFKNAPRPILINKKGIILKIPRPGKNKNNKGIGKKNEEIDNKEIYKNNDEIDNKEIYKNNDEVDEIDITNKEIDKNNKELDINNKEIDKNSKETDINNEEIETNEEIDIHNKEIQDETQAQTQETKNSDS